MLEPLFPIPLESALESLLAVEPGMGLLAVVSAPKSALLPVLELLPELLPVVLELLLELLPVVLELLPVVLELLFVLLFPAEVPLFSELMVSEPEPLGDLSLFFLPHAVAMHIKARTRPNTRSCLAPGDFINFFIISSILLFERIS